MTIEQRFERIESTLDTLIKIHLDNDREYRERLDQLATAVEKVTVSVGELAATVGQLRIAVQQDGEHIRALARIAEIRERPISKLEDEAE